MASGSASTRARLAGGRARLGDYAGLAKPRVAGLLVLTCLAAMVTAAGGVPPLGALAATLAGGLLVAGGAGALNCYLERDIDARMERTCHRPVPAGRIAPQRALGYGLALLALGSLLLWAGAGGTATGLALAGAAYYVGVYTLWLKRRTEYSIVIGGLAGAFPPLVGWAAGAGGVTPAALALAAVVVAWSPAHFWSLALLRPGDYGRAGVPMWPGVRGERATRVQIGRYAMLTAVLAVLPLALGALGPLYGVVLLGLNAAWLHGLWGMLRHPSVSETRRFFRLSIAYLGLLFLAMPLDRILAG